MGRYIRALLDNEAALAIGGVVVVANLLALFLGVELSGEQVAGINGALVFLSSLLTRVKVWSESSHQQAQLDEHHRTLKMAARAWRER